VYSKDQHALEKIRRGKAEYVVQPDGTTKFTEFERSNVENKLTAEQELERQQIIEKEDHESAYYFSLINLEKELVAEINDISKKSFETENSRQKFIKPYQVRLNKVRNTLLSPYGTTNKIKKRNRLPDPHTLAVANVIQDNPNISVDEIYYKIYECGQPGQDPLFGDRIYIDRCDDKSFEWRDAYVANSNPRPAFRGSFDDLVRRAKEFLKK